MKLFSTTLAGLMILAAPWPIGGNYLYVRTVVLVLAAVLGIMALLTCLVDRKKVRTNLLWLILPVGAVYAVIQSLDMSGPISIYPSATKSQLYVLVSGLAMFLSATVLFCHRKTIEPLMFCAALVGSAVAFVGIIQNFGWNGKVLWVYELLFGGAPFGPFVNKNNGAGFMILALTGPVYYLAKLIIEGAGRKIQTEDVFDLNLGSRRKNSSTNLIRTTAEFFARLEVRHLYCIAALIAVLCGIFFSLSRGGAVGAITALAVAIAMLSSANKKTAILAFLVGIACFAGAIWLEQSDAVSESISSIAEVDQTTDPRLLHWKDAIPYYQHYLAWGSGLGTYRYAYPSFQQQSFQGKFVHAENVYLETLAEMGITGVVALLLAIATLLFVSIQLFRRKLASDRALGVAGCFAITGLSVSSFFDFGIYQPANLILASIIFGAIVGRSQVRDVLASGSTDRAPRKIARMYRMAVLFLLVASCGYATLPSAAIESAQYARRHLELHLRSGGEEVSRLEKAENALLFAEKYLPDDWEVQFLLGQHSLYEHRQILTKQVESETEQVLRAQAIAAGASEEEIEDELPRFADYWTTTSMSNLHRIMRFAERQSPAEYEAMRADPQIVTAEIREAHRRFLQARDKNDRVEKVHFRLAQLTPMMEPVENNLAKEQQHIQRALSFAKGYTGLAYDCGLLAMHSGDFETTAELWSDCLSRNRAYQRRIIELSGELPLKLFFEEILPQNPYELLRISRIYFSKPEQKLPNQLLLIHTGRVIEASEFPQAEKFALLGQASFQANDFEKACEHFEKALESSPEKTDWRFDFARSLHEIGKFDDAIREMKICQLESPELEVRTARQIQKFKSERARQRNAPEVETSLQR